MLNMLEMILKMIKGSRVNLIRIWGRALVPARGTSLAPTASEITASAASTTSMRTIV